MPELFPLGKHAETQEPKKSRSASETKPICILLNLQRGQPSVSKQNAFVLPVSPPGLSARRHQSYLDTQRSKDLLYENELSAQQHLLDIRTLAFGSQVPIIKVKTLAQLNSLRRRDESKNVPCQNVGSSVHCTTHPSARRKYFW